MSAKYSIKQAKTQSDMSQILDIIWAANYTPYEPFVQLFFPVLGYTPSDYTTAIAKSKSRAWEQHTSTPSSNWFFVIEEGTGRAVGCAQWEVHTENPFKEGAPKLTAPWWPEGEYREFCESVLEQVYKPRASWMTRPHLALNWMSVLPTHRRQGVGSLLMTVGISLADKLNLECWMEASGMGKPLYEKHDFRSLFKIAFDMEKNNASDLWRKAEHELTPPPVFAMWRPKAGSWEVEGGQVKMPWELGMD